ncbi:methyltransferase domain-containing protein [Oryzihumus sp.]
MTSARPVTWDPAQYAVFEDHRSRPFADLMARVRVQAPRLVVDLGCGAGALTLGLAQRWAAARVVGVDSSPHMLEQARAGDPEGRVEWVEADVADWEPPAGIDLLVTNATLQWVPGHLELIPRWVAALAPGGWFAMQVPGNFEAPSHRLLRETAAAAPRSAELLATLRHGAPVAEPAAYTALLAGLGCAVDVWETTYQQVLDPAGEQDCPVLEWSKGTALRPVLDVLTGAQERADFLHAYADRLREAYPRQDFGTLFPFRRIFAVARTRA